MADCYAGWRVRRGHTLAVSHPPIRVQALLGQGFSRIPKPARPAVGWGVGATQGGSWRSQQRRRFYHPLDTRKGVREGRGRSLAISGRSVVLFPGSRAVGRARCAGAGGLRTLQEPGRQFQKAKLQCIPIFQNRKNKTNQSRCSNM